MKRFFALCVALFVFVLGNHNALASEKFDAAQFDAQLLAGQSILVVAHAPWCPTCRAQESALKSIYANDTYKKISYFIVDFDSQKEVLKKFGIQRQSTLIVFKDGKEVGRSIGATSTAAIEALLKQVL